MVRPREHGRKQALMPRHVPAVPFKQVDSYRDGKHAKAWAAMKGAAIARPAARADRRNAGIQGCRLP
jgi:hypothetical protein